MFSRKFLRKKKQATSFFFNSEWRGVNEKIKILSTFSAIFSDSLICKKLGIRCRFEEDFSGLIAGALDTDMSFFTALNVKTD